MEQRKDVNKAHLINVSKSKNKTKNYISLFETLFRNHINPCLFDVTGMYQYMYGRNLKRSYLVPHLILFFFLR